jgi:hypothetical protein
MTWQSILLVGSLLFASVPQAVDTKKWKTVGRMCGKLEWVEEVPVNRKGTEFQEKSRPLKKVEIRLYRRENESSCCGTGLPIARAVTNGRGEFNFENLVPGSYWVMVEVDGKQYSLAIKYVPSKVELSCSDLLYDIINGELQLRRVIQVD